MTLDQQKEQFSFAYVRAIAATAQIAISEPVIDDDSVDLLFQQRSGDGLVRSPRLEAQLKCTEVANVHPNHIAYPLKLKNYEDLRSADLMVPRILIVVTVPDNLDDWLNHSEAELAVRKCGYWVSLRGKEATDNQTNVTVHLPRINQFTVAGLQGIMQLIRNGQTP
jgi:hypothetical protein